MSQEELAKKCGYKSRSSIQKIECSRALPYKKMIAMAKALEVDLSYFLDDLVFLDVDYSIPMPKSESVNMNDEEANLIAKFRALTDDNKTMIKRVLQAAYAVDTHLYEGEAKE